MKTEFCDIKQENKEIKQNQKKIEEKLNENDKNNAVQFANLNSEVKTTKNATIDIKHMMLKKESEEKDKNRFGITQLIAIVSILVAVFALFKK